MIVVLPGNKLTLVKTGGIIEQQSDLRQDNFLRMPINMLAFLINLVFNQSAPY